MFALSIVLSLSFVLFSPVISAAVEATENLTVTTATTPIDEININQSDRFTVTFFTSDVGNNVPVTIYIPPNNVSSTNNNPYLFIDNNSISNSMAECASGSLNTETINYLDNNQSLPVVNITYILSNPEFNCIIDINFNATPINPLAKLYTNWTGVIDSDIYSTQAPLVIKPPHLTVYDEIEEQSTDNRIVYLGENYTISGLMVNNSDDLNFYGGDAYNVTATAENTTDSLEVISDKTIDVTSILHPGQPIDLPDWTINAKSLGLSNISITAKDQTGDYNDTINITINVVNLTVTPSILEENPKIGEIITIVANITDNASNLYPLDINSIYANLTYLALNESSGNIDVFESQPCPTSSFEINQTLSGKDYTVFTCNTYIPQRSGFYNVTISVTDQYFAYNGAETILNSKTAINTSDFTISFGKVNITETFAMMLAVNDSFDNPQGFWQHGKDTSSGSSWEYDYGEGVMKKTDNDNPNYNILTALPESTDTYIEVEIDDIKSAMGITFKYNDDTVNYKFYYLGYFLNKNYFSLKKLNNDDGFEILKYVDIDLGGIHKFAVYAIGNELICLVDGQVIIREYDPNLILSGKTGLYSSSPVQGTQIFDNFKVYNILDPKDGLLNDQTFELRSFTETIDGDIWGPTDYTLSIADSKISNISGMTSSDTSNLEIGTTQIMNWNLETKELGDTNLTIDITPTNGIQTTTKINTTIVPLFVYPVSYTRDYGFPEILYINVTGFGPSLQGPNGMFSANIKQQYRETSETITDFIFNSGMSNILNNNYVYWAYYTQTHMSGNYDLNFTMRDQYDQNITNTTESFFVNYGHLDIVVSDGLKTIQGGTYGKQSIEITAYSGDVRNITLNFTSYNTTVINISSTDVINRSHNILVSGTSSVYSWNVSAINEGVSNVTVKGNASLGSVLVANNNTINVTAAADTEAPKINNVSVGYNLVNLKENITINADITDNYYVETATVQVFYPNLSGYSENYTMEYNYSDGKYYFLFPNTTILTNETDFYRIKIYATDSADQLNASDNTTTFNTTDQYTIDLLLNNNLLNRGEDMISQIVVKTVNNNPITDFNLTLNMKKAGDENDTVLLPNNQTDNYPYNINASDPIGLYTLDMNVSKYGNKANFSGNFTVSNIYTLDFKQPTSNYLIQQPQANLYGYASPLIQVLNARGEKVESWGVDVWMTCAQPSNLSLFVEMDWDYYVDTGTEACGMPSFEGPFDILAFANDTYNNSGASSLQMTIQAYNAPEGGGDTGGTSPQSPGFTPAQDPTDYAWNEKMNEFFFYTDMRDLNMFQGEVREMTFSLDNTGDYDLNITTSYELDGLTIEMNKTYFVKSKNKQSITIKILSTLSDTPKTYSLKLKMAEGEIVKEETLKIWLEKNQLIYDLEYLEFDLLRINDMISDLNRIGMDTKPYMQQLELSEQLLRDAKTAIESNNVTALQSQTTRLSDTLKILDDQLKEKEQLRWLLENKHNIAGILISTIMLLFLLKEFIYPLIFLTIKVQRLKSRQTLLEAEEKSTEKEYFTRVIDKMTFNKIITKKHEQLTEVRTQLIHMQNTLKKLMHGHRIKSEDLGKTHSLKQKIRLTLKKRPTITSLKLPSLKGLYNPLTDISITNKNKSKNQAPKTTAPIDLAEKTPIYPQTSTYNIDIADIKTQDKQPDKETNLGIEMRNIYGGNDTKEDQKESFDDIKKKINNIFDD
ncbi:MAG: hypothetical protein GQ477_03850 [Nanohaloarchaea archaeon]|nr:hypothetical protein [Candidatus Nanohaloarchaea archaeon]